MIQRIRIQYFDVVCGVVVHPAADVNLLLLYAKAFNIKQDETLVLYSSALIRLVDNFSSCTSSTWPSCVSGTL